jgi:hypothetical protein
MSGAPPFANTVDNALFPIVSRGLRPPKPNGDYENIRCAVDESLWNLIVECWAQIPKNRPIAAAVTSRLAELRAKKPRAIPDVSYFRTSPILATLSRFRRSSRTQVQVPRATPHNPLSKNYPTGLSCPRAGEADFRMHR